MPTSSHHKARRAEFLAAIEQPVLLMAGGWISRNYPANWSPFRADSTFLFFFPQAEPNAAALFDPKDKSVTLFLDERTQADALWHGPVQSFADLKKAFGVTAVEKRAELAKLVGKQIGKRTVRTLAIADPRATAEACSITGERLDFFTAKDLGDPALLQTIARLRNHKQEPELAEMRAAAAVTREAHTLAMARTRAGIREQELVGHVEGTFARHGCVPAYNTILSVRGEVLHNHAHDNLLLEGDLVLLDAGAERPSGYCADVTRAWPVNGHFGPEARDIYDIVLAAEKAAIASVKPGMRYRDVHMLAARVLTDGLVQLGLMHGDADALVENGAHAMFFPHGTGHLLGLDVHDLEAFGDAIAYAPGRTRSPQFGTGYLRLDLDLQPGMCVTIEPGIYFVPAILHDAKFRKQFKGQVDFQRAEQFLTMNSGRGFGGIRIEDDVLCTKTGHEVLSAAVPKERLAIEALVGSAGG
ncbi:MAG: aminopeptidase P family protein [Planctomycetes bacterium]|jgi:Xaa-Pro aminopeptidase|nr:aminopeptidase P family protein [Planctomycetota bacterium]